MKKEPTHILSKFSFLHELNFYISTWLNNVFWRSSLTPFELSPSNCLFKIQPYNLLSSTLQKISLTLSSSKYWSYYQSDINKPLNCLIGKKVFLILTSINRFLFLTIINIFDDFIPHETITCNDIFDDFIPHETITSNDRDPLWMNK